MFLKNLVKKKIKILFNPKLFISYFENHFKKPLNKPNKNEKQIHKIYLKLLDRKADETGLNHYSKRLESGDSIANIEKEIKSSKEYNQNKLKVTWADFFDIRENINTLKNFYINENNKLILNYTHQINHLYSFYLKRNPNLEEFEKHLKDLWNGIKIKQIEIQIKNSEEFFYLEKRRNKYLEDFINDNYRIEKIRYIITNQISSSSWNQFRFSSFLLKAENNADCYKKTSTHLEKLDISCNVNYSIETKEFRNYILNDNSIVINSCDNNSYQNTIRFVSHLNILRNAFENNDSEIFLILEDDIRLFPDPNLIGLNSLFDKVDWDVFLLEGYWNGTNYNDCFEKNIKLYETGIIFRRFDSLIDRGIGGYFIKRKFVEKIIKYLFVFEKNKFKIDLRKTLIYGSYYNNDISTFIYRFGNTLVSTFPLAQKCLLVKSKHKCYENFLLEKRLRSEIYNYQNWIDNYKYY